MEDLQYAEPRLVQDTNDCFFYHKMQLPDAGEVGVSWDVRPCIDDYLGQCDFQGKRVLDVGTASGYLTFEIEKRGADVVSFDMPSADNWNFVPHFKAGDVSNLRAVRGDSHRKLQNAYWYAHRQLNSNAKAYYGDIYQLPEQLGNFDVVVMGMVVTHVRDPFQAIHSAARLSKDLVVITNQVPKMSWWKRLRGKRPQVNFIPSMQDEIVDAWWFLPPKCIERMLGAIGFEVIRTTESYPECVTKTRTGVERCVSIVARRIGGTPAGIDSNQRGTKQAAA